LVEELAEELSEERQTWWKNQKNVLVSNDATMRSGAKLAVKRVQEQGACSRRKMSCVHRPSPHKYEVRVVVFDCFN
jgi:hypothetical protein